MTAGDWIKKRRALEQAAAVGPWDVQEWEDFHGKKSWTIENVARFRGHLTDSIDLGEDGDTAAFIADVRTSLPLALDALEKVLALHQPEPFHDDPSTSFCDRCQRTAGIWPCETVATIESMVGGEQA